MSLTQDTASARKDNTAMSFSPSAPRKHLHTRNIEFHGYLREDGLWDIEAEMRDTRNYEFLSREQAQMPAQTRVHNMLIRVTVNDDLVIQAIESAMPVTPFAECGQAASPLHKLIGARMGGGWRRTIDAAMGGVAGCTHMRELLFNMATAAFQTVPVYRLYQQRATGASMSRMSRPPPQMGKCLAWDFNGPVVQRVAPEFYRWRPPQA